VQLQMQEPIIFLGMSIHGQILQKDRKALGTY